MSVGAEATAAARTACTTHVVAAGDTLSAIAARCGTTVEAITRANPSITHPDLIFVGQILTIPGPAA